MKTDILKAALLRKKENQKNTNGKNNTDTTHGIHNSQVNTKKPTKKSTGRGR